MTIPANMAMLDCWRFGICPKCKSETEWKVCPNCDLPEEEKPPWLCAR